MLVIESAKRRNAGCVHRSRELERVVALSVGFRSAELGADAAIWGIIGPNLSAGDGTAIGPADRASHGECWPGVEVKRLRLDAGRRNFLRQHNRRWFIAHH